MRTYLVVALFVVSVPAVAHAGDSDPSSSQSADDCCSTAVYASDENQADDVAEAVGADVLFSGEPTYGIYLAPAFETGRIADQGGVFFGGRGGLIISDVLTIGGGINWLLDGPRAAVDGLPAIRMRHGGGLIGLTLASDQIIHPSIDLLIGGGRIAYDYEQSLLSDEQANVFVLDFSTGFDLNITHGIRAHLGGGYRHVSDFELEGLTDEEVDGFFAGIQLKFGTF